MKKCYQLYKKIGPWAIGFFLAPLAHPCPSVVSVGINCSQFFLEPFLASFAELYGLIEAVNISESPLQSVCHYGPLPQFDPESDTRIAVYGLGSTSPTGPTLFLNREGLEHILPTVMNTLIGGLLKGNLLAARSLDLNGQIQPTEPPQAKNPVRLPFYLPKPHLALVTDPSDANNSILRSWSDGIFSLATFNLIDDGDLSFEVFIPNDNPKIPPTVITQLAATQCQWNIQVPDTPEDL